MKMVEGHPFKVSGSAKKAIILFAKAEMGFLGSMLSEKVRKWLFLSGSTCWKTWL